MITPHTLTCRFRPLEYSVTALCALAIATVALVVPAHAQTVVKKVAEPFESAGWTVGDDSSAGGSVTLAANTPAEIAASSTKSMELAAAFTGTSFEALSVRPKQPLVIPGVTKS